MDQGGEPPPTQCTQERMLDKAEAAVGASSSEVTDARAGQGLGTRVRKEETLIPCHPPTAQMSRHRVVSPRLGQAVEGSMGG